MRPFTHTIPFDEALRRVLDAAVPIDRTEVLPIADADGRVAAEDVTARIDVPPFNRAAMDGYAVRAVDTQGATADAPRALACLGQILAGQVPAYEVGGSDCVEIATGAPVPAGADAVVMVEHTNREADTVRVMAAAAPGQHIGRRGSDLGAGQRAVRIGDVLSPARIGAVAATGEAHIRVFARPSVAILSTGNELAAPGEPLQPGQIYDVNRFTLDAVIRRHGGTTTSLPAAGDVLAVLGETLRTAADGHDIILASGGSSVGTRDLLRDALGGCGDVIFHGIAVKPGKPTLFGRIGRAAVFGMPGNPTSCLSNAYMLLVPFLRQTARLPAWTPRRVRLPLARRIVSVVGRHQFYTVRIVDGQAVPAFKGSGEITSLAEADGYIEIRADRDAIESGTEVEVVLF
jgi:molybdenum cofactor synthesis domain-containing protein